LTNFAANAIEIMLNRSIMIKLESEYSTLSELRLDI